MMKLLRPTLTGWLLMVPVGVFVFLPSTSWRYSPGTGASEIHTELGFLTWLSWDSPGTWHLSVAAVPMLMGLYAVPTMVGQLLSRARRWRMAPRSLWLFAAVPVLAVAASVAFSLSYWGYAWSLPALDHRVSEVRWTRISAFRSNNEGTGWVARPREDLNRLRIEPAEDLECCQDGRIIGVLGSRLPSLGDIAPAELSALESDILSNIELDPGEPEYQQARSLHGVVVVGEGAGGAPLAFASFTSGEVSNDHHAMYEVLLERAPNSRRLSWSRTYGDVAGIEGTTAARLAVFLCVLGFMLTPALLIVWAALRTLASLVSGWRARAV